MTNRIYCIFDDLAQRFGQVYACPSDGVATMEISRYLQVRNRDGSVDKEESQLALQRYHLYYTADIDIETGRVVPVVPPVRIPWTGNRLEVESVEEKTTLPLAN